MSLGKKDIVTVLVVLVLVMGVAALIRRLLWSTYNTINKSFELLKKELIALGFARGATVEDGDTPRNMKSTRTSSHASEKYRCRAKSNETVISKVPFHEKPTHSD